MTKKNKEEVWEVGKCELCWKMIKSDEPYEMIEAIITDEEVVKRLFHSKVCADKWRKIFIHDCVTAINSYRWMMEGLMKSKAYDEKVEENQELKEKIKEFKSKYNWHKVRHTKLRERCEVE